MKTIKGIPSKITRTYLILSGKGSNPFFINFLPDFSRVKINNFNLNTDLFWESFESYLLYLPKDFLVNVIFKILK